MRCIDSMGFYGFCRECWKKPYQGATLNGRSREKIWQPPDPGATFKQHL